MKDVAPGEQSSGPNELTTADGLVYFFACADGFGLWRSDGTEHGTTLVRVLYRSPDGCDTWSFYPSFYGLTAVSGKVFFVGTDGKHGKEIWVSDGTFEGTRLLKDIRPGLDESEPEWLTAAAGALYFTADDGEHGRELWTSDGTAAGTRLVRDIHPGVEDGFAAYSIDTRLVTLADRLFFTATDGDTGLELWTTDGTSAGTQLVIDFTPGEPGTFGPGIHPIAIHPMATTDRLLFFQAWNGASNTLVATDGTAEGTRRLHDGLRGRDESGIVAVGETVYFTAFNVSGYPELWRTDGTVQGTDMVTQVRATQMTSVGPSLFFIGRDQPNPTLRIWSSDGTESGTKPIEFFCGGVPAADCDESSAFLSFALNGLALISRNDGVHGEELYGSDGTTAGSGLVKEIFGPTERPKGTRVSFVGGLDDIFLFASGSELWRSDGTDSGTQLVRALEGIGSGIALDGRLYFSAHEAGTPSSLWRTDGTTAGTSPVPGTDDLAPTPIAVVSNLLLFLSHRVEKSESRSDLWVTDGTNGAQQLSTTSFQAGYAAALTANKLFFITSEANRSHLWISDGTKPGSMMLRDFGDVTLDVLGVQADWLFFMVTDRSDATLWRSDGTPSGTAPVSVSVDAQGPVARTFFHFYRSGNATRLWAIDAPQGWIRDVAEFEASSLGGFGYIGSTFVFGLFEPDADGVFHRSLWRTDGTAGGTQRLKETGPDPFDSSFSFTSIGSGAIFTGYAPELGVELWYTDGTRQGTRLVEDIAPGAFSSVPPVNEYSPPVATADHFFFIANDGRTGNELWTLPLRPACLGDCDRDGMTTIAEAVSAVAIALEHLPIDSCQLADTDGDGSVSTTDLVGIVRTTLQGCSRFDGRTDY